jgi:hypothetical protein
VYENKLQRRIFGPKREWRKTVNKELHNYYEGHQVWEDQLSRACTTPVKDES